MECVDYEDFNDLLIALGSQEVATMLRYDRLFLIIIDVVAEEDKFINVFHACVCINNKKGRNLNHVFFGMPLGCCLLKNG